MPGVVLLHTYTDAVETPTLLLGTTSAAGVPMPRLSSPARVLLVLLVPRACASDAYLRVLALAAQLVRSEATVEALLSASTPEGARDVLLSASRSAHV
jgi:mannitol/fructose-specific phosphotransferase system IIA component (Ntr-type)